MYISPQYLSTLVLKYLASLVTRAWQFCVHDRPRPMSLALLTGWRLRTLFPARWYAAGYSCMLVVTCAVFESVWSKKELCSRALHEASVLYMHSRQGSTVNHYHATMRAQERNALQIFTQNWPFKSRNCTYFGNNHGRDTKSRHKAKITVITAIVNSWCTYIPSYNLLILTLIFIFNFWPQF